VGFISRMQKEDWLIFVFCFVAFYLDASRIREHRPWCLEKMVLVSRRDSCRTSAVRSQIFGRPLLPVFPRPPAADRVGRRTSTYAHQTFAIRSRLQQGF
jgi:hypothetical protein